MDDNGNENMCTYENRSEFTKDRSGTGDKEGYEDSVLRNHNIIKSETEIVDYHMSDDYGDEESLMGFSDSDDSVLTQLNTGPENKSKKKKPLGPFDLHFMCEWNNCSYETNEDSKFHVHVSYHIPDVAIRTLGDGEEVYMCLWAECNYLTAGSKEIQRHVTYHSYHTKLKNIGEKIMKEWDLPKCMYGTETKNMIPDKIEPMICEWKDCNKEFNNVQVFLYHILMHVNENFMEPNSKKQTIRCKWDGCKNKSNMISRTRLTDHMRTHSREKVVGCPVCGHLFATNTKLSDHCKRQLPSELSGFQCSHCYKQFASLRLLKDHMRGHVNFYKCCYCDMTCTSRHTFSAHIRYKHLDCKPFSCSFCDYKCKTQFDLKAHLTSSHVTENAFKCEEDGCQFSCRSKRTLQKHAINVHQVSSAPVYCCHLPDCQHKYKRGCYLTKHLMTKHCLRWPSGHSKFMYHRQEDGTYRLQTVRYESVKLYGENSSITAPSKENFKLTQGDNSRSFKVSTIEAESSNAASEVLISIEDESGNTINSCTAPEVVGDKIPKNATVIAIAQSSESDEENQEA